MTKAEALARADLRRLLEEVGESRGLSVARDKYPCPELGHAQSGATPPASVREQNGVDVWYCHTCEKGGTIIDALVCSGRARDVADAFDQLGIEKAQRESRPGGPVPGRVVAEYVYTLADGSPFVKVVRWDPKDFRQWRWEDGRWVPGTRGIEHVPYRLPEALAALAAGKPLVVVEGEKDADRLARDGIAATTNPGGKGKWTPAMSDALAGAAHRVFVVADDDDEGHRHAADVWRKFQGKVGQCVALLPAEGFKDVSDMLDAGVAFTRDHLRRLPFVADAPPPVPANGRPGPMMMTARAMASRPALGQAAQVVGPLFQRGMRTTIGAGTGEGKTTFAFQAIRALINRTPFLDDSWVPPRPGRALIIDLEQGEEVVKRRLREAGLADSESVDVLWEPAGMALDTDASHQALIRDTIAAGRYDLVLVDPLYQMHRGSGNDEQLAASLMNLVDGWARELDFALVIPMHARKPHPQAGKNMTIHDIAGSTSWNRNAEFVVGLQVMFSGKSRVHFFKDRVGDGPPLQSHWWLDFSRDPGFRRGAAPHADAAARKAALESLLQSAVGATEDELVAAGALPIDLRRIRRDYFVRDGRWRSTDWNQTSLLADDAPTFVT